MPLKLIKDQYGRTDILAPNSEHAVDSEWLALQMIKPSDQPIWHTAYPLSGGVVSVQQGQFTVIGDVTTEHMVKALNNATASAMRTLLDLWREHGK